MQVLTMPLNFKINGFGGRNMYVIECSRSIYSSFAISIINPARWICPFSFSRQPGSSFTLIILNVEFYWDFESTFFSRFTHRGE